MGGYYNVSHVPQPVQPQLEASSPSVLMCYSFTPNKLPKQASILSKLSSVTNFGWILVQVLGKNIFESK